MEKGAVSVLPPLYLHATSFFPSSSSPPLLSSFPGDPWPCGTGVESKASRPVRGNLPLPVLATRPLDGCGCGRPSASQRGWSAALLPLGHGARVLERPVGEGLCQVRTLAGPRLLSVSLFVIYVLTNAQYIQAKQLFSHGITSTLDDSTPHNLCPAPLLEVVIRGKAMCGG